MTFKAKVNQGNMIMISSYNLTADFSILKEYMIMRHDCNLVKLKDEKKNQCLRISFMLRQNRKIHGM